MLVIMFVTLFCANCRDLRHLHNKSMQYVNFYLTKITGTPISEAHQNKRVRLFMIYTCAPISRATLCRMTAGIYLIIVFV